MSSRTLFTLQNYMETGLRPVYRDILLTIVTAILVAFGGMVAVSVVGSMGPEALAEFILLRRVATWLVSVLLLGMGVCIARFVAQFADKPEVRDAYFVAALAISAVLIIPIVFVMNIAAPAFALVLLGSESESPLVYPLSILLVAYVFHGIVFAYYRGRLLMTHANVLLFVTFALIPVMSVFFLRGGQSIAMIYWVIGLLTLLA